MNTRTFLKSLLLLLLVVIVVLVYLFWMLSKPRGNFAKTPENFSFLFGIYAYASGDNLNLPHALTTDEDGNIYVADTGNSRVLVFDSKGQPVRKIGEGKLVAPVGISIAKDNKDIYVSDRIQNAVAIFDSKGKLKKSFYMHMPLDVEVVKDKVYVTTFGPVFITSREGKVVQKIGSRGRAPGQFDFANGIAVGAKGDMYVSDLNNLRLQSLDKSGEIKWIVGDPPKDMQAVDRRFGLPAGVTLDEKERIYLVDAFHHSLRILSNKGKELAEYGERGNEEGQLYQPAGIVYLGDGKIAIADKYNNRINVYKISNLDGLN